LILTQVTHYLISLPLSYFLKAPHFSLSDIHPNIAEKVNKILDDEIIGTKDGVT